MSLLMERFRDPFADPAGLSGLPGRTSKQPFESEYEQTGHYTLTRRFMNDHARMLKELLSDDDED